jgi:hypothetical protein
MSARPESLKRSLRPGLQPGGQEARRVSHRAASSGSSEATWCPRQYENGRRPKAPMAYSAWGTTTCELGSGSLEGSPEVCLASASPPRPLLTRPASTDPHPMMRPRTSPRTRATAIILSTSQSSWRQLRSALWPLDPCICRCSSLNPMAARSSATDSTSSATRDRRRRTISSRRIRRR